jgi:hypothetical protein
MVLLHAGVELPLTLIRLYTYTPVVLVGTCICTVFPAVVVMVCGGLLPTVYVKVYGAIPLLPVKVNIGAVASLQMVVPPVNVASGRGFTVIIITFERDFPPHTSVFVISTEISSLFTKALVMYVLLTSPAIGVMPKYHWYCAEVPPLVGVALKVTEVPEQIGLAEATMLTEGATEGITLTRIGAEVAGLLLVQFSVDNILTVITSLFNKVLEINVLPVATALVPPLIYHAYDGVPPFIGVAVNVTSVPEQKAPFGL